MTIANCKWLKTAIECASNLFDIDSEKKFFFFVFSRATPMAYGDSQVRGLIRAVAAGLQRSHSNTGSELRVFILHHCSWQRQILNPLSEARDQTHNLVVPSQIHSPLSHNGNSRWGLFHTTLKSITSTCQPWKNFLSCGLSASLLQKPCRISSPPSHWWQANDQGQHLSRLKVRGTKPHLLVAKWQGCVAGEYAGRDTYCICFGGRPSGKE